MGTKRLQRTVAWFAARAQIAALESFHPQSEPRQKDVVDQCNHQCCDQRRCYKLLEGIIFFSKEGQYDKHKNVVKHQIGPDPLMDDHST
jgi:hypothetical protein